MNARYLHPSAKENAAARPDPGDGTLPAPPADVPGRACCCPGTAAVLVTMPPAHGRSRETDLLLCGHHYLRSRQVLEAAGASVCELPGTAPDIASWLRDTE